MSALPPAAAVTRRTTLLGYGSCASAAPPNETAAHTAQTARVCQLMIFSLLRFQRCPRRSKQPGRAALHEPVNHRRGVGVGRKDGIEHVLDGSAVDDHRQALDERHAVDFESREVQRLGEFELFVGEELERQVESATDFLLIRGVLRAQAEYRTDSQRL